MRRVIDYDRAYRILSKEWKIPEKKFGDVILSYISRHDELTKLMAELLIDIDKKLDNINKPIRVEIDVSQISAEINKAVTEISEKIGEMSKVVTRPQRIEMVSSERHVVDTSRDEIHDISKETDLVIIHNIGDEDIAYMFNTPTSTSSPRVLSKGGVMINISKSYSRLYMRGISGSSEVIVSEWKYV